MGETNFQMLADCDRLSLPESNEFNLMSTGHFRVTADLVFFRKVKFFLPFQPGRGFGGGGTLG